MSLRNLVKFIKETRTAWYFFLSWWLSCQCRDNDVIKHINTWLWCLYYRFRTWVLLLDELLLPITVLFWNFITYFLIVVIYFFYYFLSTHTNNISFVHTLSVRDRLQILLLILTHETPKLPSYRSQSIDLLRKSIDWFLYDGNFGAYELCEFKQID